MAYIIVILISVVASWLTTKIVTTKYFDVIDGYVNGLLKEVVRIVQETVGNKK